MSAIGSQSVDEGQTLNIAFSANDVDGDGLAFSATGLPTFCNLTDNLSGTGSISCTPGVTDAGSYVVTVIVTDNGTPSFNDSEAVTITVSATNEAPILNAIGDRSVDESQVLNVLLSATDVDGDGLAFNATGLPTFCNLTDNFNGTGSISCSPGATDAGNYPISIVVTDNGVPNLNDSEALTIMVSATNEAPVLSVIGNQNVDESQVLNVLLSANDADGNGLAFDTIGLPAFCSLIDNLNGTGSISCAPGATDAGTYPVTVTVTDNGSPSLSDNEAVTITVSATNDAPVLNAIGNQSVDEVQILNVSLSSTDADGDGLAFSTIGLPTFCSLTDNLNGTGSVSCSPGAIDAGVYFVTVIVTDNGTPALNDNEALTITVNSVNQTPTLAAIGSQTVDEGQVLNVSLSSIDPDGDGIVFSASGLPTFCSLTDNLNGSGNINCTPGATDAGSYPISVTVTDNGTPNLNSSEALTITVNAINDAPVLSVIGDQSVDESQVLNVPLSASDADGDGLVLSVTGLPTFCSFTDNLNGTGGISCSPGATDAGPYLVTVMVTDNGTPNRNDSEALTITVIATNEAPVLTGIGNQSVNEGLILNVPLSSSDADGDALSYSSTGLPTFCSLTDNLNGTGNINCTPGATDAGSYPVSVTVTDNATPGLSASEALTITVAATNDAPVLSAIGSQSVDESLALNVSLSATDADGDGLAFSATGLPTFCSLTDNLNGTGNLSCAPGATDAGSYSISITVTDNGTPASNDSEALTITVNATNEAPVLGLIGGQSVDESQVLNIPLSSSDADGDGLVFSATGLPAFCSLTDNLNGSGRISCTPGATDAGPYPVTVTVTDNGTPALNDSEALTITVSTTNEAPTLNPIGNQAADEGQTLNVALSATDVDGDGLAFSATGLPAFCSLADNLNGSGILSCAPGVTDAGSYPVTVTVTDNGIPNLNSSEALTIVIGGVNQVPTLNFVGNQSVNEGQILNVPLSATDVDGDALIFSATGLPTFCSLTDNLNGSANLSCAPGATDAGAYPVALVVTDNGTPNLNDNELLTITVNATNEAPVLSVIGNQSVNEGQTLNIPLSSSDMDGDWLVISATSLPVFCSLTDNLNGTGNLSCTPGATDAGSYPIAVTVTDNGTPNLNDSEALTITVGGVNEAPILNTIGNQSIDESQVLNVLLSSTDVDGDGLAFNATGLPTFCSLTDNLNGTGTLSCAPGATAAGNYPVTVTITDNGTPVLSDSEALTITVNSTNEAPLLSAIGNQTVDEGQVLNVLLSSSDADGDGLLLSTVGLPAFCSLTDNLNGSGTITCTPGISDQGSYPVTVAVVDNGTPALNDSEALTITVNGINQAPTLSAIGNQTVDEGQVLNVALSSSDADGDGLAFSVTGLPTFCSLTDNVNGSGNINCTPGATDAGSYPVTVTVTDNGTPNLNDSSLFTVTVNAVNQAPNLDVIGDQVVNEGQTLNVALSSSDPDGDGLVLNSTGLPVR